VRLGALVLQKEPWVQARDTWRQVERAGFDIGYVADHLTHSTVAGQWWADGWTTLAAAAEATSTLGIGTLVGSAAIRGPAFVARVAATLQDISGGRFVLGLGAGTAPDVLVDRGEVVGAEVLAERYREVVLAIRALWAGETMWRGQHVAVEGVAPAALAPGSPAPPLVLAAHARAGFDLVAAQAVRPGGSAG
jgi:alkanesulfonate monooxygenase SsuD/methylene tetrahydromethanopterin reductase-like flavin-dependent oxidoreductase (luciferase family)